MTATSGPTRDLASAISSSISGLQLQQGLPLSASVSGRNLASSMSATRLAQLSYGSSSHPAQSTSTSAATAGPAPGSRDNMAEQSMKAPLYPLSESEHSGSGDGDQRTESETDEALVPQGTPAGAAATSAALRSMSTSGSRRSDLQFLSQSGSRSAIATSARPANTGLFKSGSSVSASSSSLRGLSSQVAASPAPAAGTAAAVSGATTVTTRTTTTTTSTSSTNVAQLASQYTAIRESLSAARLSGQGSNPALPAASSVTSLNQAPSGTGSAGTSAAAAPLPASASATGIGFPPFTSSQPAPRTAIHPASRMRPT